ncbi:hypothetical protein [Pseudacidovorax intermedius]|uniref:hypothetical protein n=1 Tax=Pseudacidovorax intermedius TaxID=433924 RepID=UPI003F805D9C
MNHDIFFSRMTLTPVQERKVAVVRFPASALKDFQCRRDPTSSGDATNPQFCKEVRCTGSVCAQYPGNPWIRANNVFDKGAPDALPTPAFRGHRHRQAAVRHAIRDGAGEARNSAVQNRDRRPGPSANQPLPGIGTFDAVALPHWS